MKKLFSKPLVLAAFVLISLGAALGRSDVHRIVSPELLVVPDRVDRLYDVGDPVTFTVSVVADGRALPDVDIEYRVGPEEFESKPVSANTGEGNFLVSGGSLETPGFIRCKVTANIAGVDYFGVGSAAIDPFSIQPTQVEPDDFDAFWEEQLAKLEEIPLELKRTLMPHACTSAVNVYKVEYQSRGMAGPVRFYGILAEPVAEGAYPAVLQLPGAGVRPYTADIGLSAKGFVVLNIGIHGIPIDLEGPIYEDLKWGGLRDYWAINLDDREKYYYNRVYLGCVRANDALVRNPKWDGKNLIAAGGSQGGQLSIVTSVLDPRVTGTVANFPAFCDVSGSLSDRAAGWPKMFLGDRHREPGKIETSRYYDTVNFAKRLKAPVDLAWGYNDVVCPPTTLYAAYNVIQSPKTLSIEYRMGHSASGVFRNFYYERILSIVR